MRATQRCALIVLSLALGSLAFAAPECTKVNGKFSEFVIDPFGSPNDPLGRVVLVAQGTINAVGTAILTTVGPGPTPGTLGATTRHVFVESEANQLTALGVAVFTPLGPTSVDVHDDLVLTIQGGTGKYAHATGTIYASGTGFNFFPLPPGPSSANKSIFEFQLSGEICGVTGQ